MELDRRKQLILRAIVTEYVDTAEPVGSERLAENPDFHAKSATIRNEMAALAALGYVIQPHTSAGRIPTDKGYRFFVDRLMKEDRTRKRLQPNRLHAELDEILHQTCRILSSLTRCAAVATLPERRENTIQVIHIISVTATRALAVAILNSGEVISRIVELEESLPASAITALSNLFHEALTGRTPAEVRSVSINMPNEMRGLSNATTRIFSALAEALTPEPDRETIIEGATKVLREPEFRSEVRRERLLEALENRREILESLRSMETTHAAGSAPEGTRGDVVVTIGSENRREGMRDYSFVMTRYRVGIHMTGSVGVFGPTRMAYQRAVPAVRAMGMMLGDLLTQLAVEP